MSSQARASGSRCRACNPPSCYHWRLQAGKSVGGAELGAAHLGPLKATARDRRVGPSCGAGSWAPSSRGDQPYRLRTGRRRLRRVDPNPPAATTLLHSRRMSHSLARPQKCRPDYARSDCGSIAHIDTDYPSADLRSRFALGSPVGVSAAADVLQRFDHGFPHCRRETSAYVMPA